MTNSASGTAVRVADWLNAARQQTAQDSDSGEHLLETQVLLAHVLGRPRAWVLAHPEYSLSSAQQSEMQRLAAQRASGAPLPYLLGEWEFYGLTFAVSPAVLIPRPETELLVERALAWLRAHADRRNIADVGTGSGCIAVTLAQREPGRRVLAVDRSRAALEIARRNAARHSTAVNFLQGDLLSAAAGPFDLVCANLPYIPSAGLEQLPVARVEPRLALDGGPDGLELVRALVSDAPRWLAPGGLLLLEIQYDQGEAAVSAASAAMPASRVQIHRDLAGLDRVVEIERG